MIAEGHTAGVQEVLNEREIYHVGLKVWDVLQAIVHKCRPGATMSDLLVIIAFDNVGLSPLCTALYASHSCTMSLLCPIADL